MRRLVVAFVLLLILSCWLPGLCQNTGLQTAPPATKIEPPSPNATVEQLESRGDELRVLKAYADSIDYYRAAIAKQKSAALYNKLGIAELQMSRLSDARRDFGRAIKMQKDYAEAHNNMGVVLYTEKRYGSAEKEYKKAILLQDSASFHSNLGSAYFAQKKFDIAAIEYSKALQLDPDIFERASSSGISAHLRSPADQAKFSYVLARMYAQLGNFDRSFKYLEKAMEDGYNVKGEIYKDQTFTKLREDPRFTELMTAKTVAIPE